MRFDIDLNGKYIPTDRSWQFGIGNDHAFQLLRKDVLEHLKLAHDKLGIKYVRFHGIFDDDMQVVQRLSDLSAFRVLPNCEKIKELSFKQIAVVLDNILEIGMKPFVELSFMPTALSSSDKTGLRYRANINMPADLNEWAEFIKKFIIFIRDRYGKEEVRSWYFEVWNEPDLPIFFSGTMQDYFALYKATATAIKEVDGKLRVGGPATSACKWIDEFLTFCEESGSPCDFVSTHHYPGDAFGNSLDGKEPRQMGKIAQECADNNIPLGQALEKLFYVPSEIASKTKGEFIQMEKDAVSAAKGKPLFITEWNSCSVNPAPIHDEKFSSAFVIKSVMDKNPAIQAYMFWCCSDVFEEIFNLNKPFHGSFGIVNNDGIPKPNFWAFWLLSRLYDERLSQPVTNDNVEYAVFKAGDKKQILVYSQNFNPVSNDEYEIELNVNVHCNKVRVIKIDDLNANPKRIWNSMSSPDTITKEQAELIMFRSKPAKKAQTYKTDEKSTVFKLSIRTNDVALIEFE